MACLVTATTPAQADSEAHFDIPPQPLAEALRDFAMQSGFNIMADATLATGKRSSGYTATAEPEVALQTLLADSGLGYSRDGDTIVITSAADVKRTVAQVTTTQAGTGARTIVDNNEELSAGSSLEEIIVTAQKMEESIQEVPIAVSAFSSEGLDDLKIERGEELLRAVPNVAFSKSNFSGYNFSIRGIGTKAISASTDPAVAVSFNNTPLIRNRLFEQEFFDVQRVEVLRGPQGTLYGRNATGGVVNVLPVLPESDFGGEIEAEVGNFDTRRLSGNLNIPVTESFSLRFAGALTKRDGFDTNTFTGNDVNDRDLYSTRAIAQWEPSDRFSANLLWQHFKEDDRRSRTGKQLCNRDPGRATVGSVTVREELRGRLSQGCLPGSLYDAEAFGAPNGAGLAFVTVASTIEAGRLAGGSPINVIDFGVDPYAGVQQSRDLREIATSYDPVFRAENDLVQFNLEVSLNDNLQFFSQSTYASDDYYSSQDYNRFVSDTVFNDSADLFNVLGQPNPDPGPTPEGIFTDPQLGPSDRVLSVDISQSDNEQWSQEFRLQSSFDGTFNFSLGANYLDFESQDDYYVFNNTFTLIGEYLYNSTVGESPFFVGTRNCDGFNELRECVYIDPNPLGQLNDEGHNYFLSRNLVETKSWAVFGEAYWQVSQDVKVTGGLRYTKDRKTATPIPSQLLLGAENFGTQPGSGTGGRVSRGYPADDDIKQQWNEFTGRFVIDWQTQTPFTDETLVYLSLAHGYKGGGSNPPRVDIDQRVVQYQPLEGVFKPEFVNAIELGTKNSLYDGSLILNTTAFYYNYRDYQISQIVDRISFNENFDAESWGLEIESSWQATPNTRIDLNLGYLKTRIGKGEESIDVMNRTQGNEDWMLVRPWLQVPSNCIAPVDVVEAVLGSLPLTFSPPSAAVQPLAALCGGANRVGSYSDAIDTVFRWDQLLLLDQPGFDFNYNPFEDAPNNGRGFAADLSGNELPNSPNFTFNLGVQHIFDIRDWQLKLRADYYRQSDSYARVYNTVYDELEAWDNLNAAVTLTHPPSLLQMQLYVKNIFDDAPITDTFTNSDDTGLSANVFTLEPRIFGFSVNKQF
ncbi:TonB-dependent receptor [Exilibacterium tricleocarpae]|uniref:TonB-dependent receptor n=2 Tax=Exilibacterium tricleocarpae TaxID=2591008 RepID=A0A545TP02_9GAMM|nr:TonB-dependent receptor [Exilibacterium tricleocarpae]